MVSCSQNERRRKNSSLYSVNQGVSSWMLTGLSAMHRRFNAPPHTHRPDVRQPQGYSCTLMHEGGGQCTA